MLALGLWGCGGPSTLQLLTRAAFDMNCEQAELTITEIDNRTRGVEGCGKRATYVKACSTNRWTGVMDCTWLLNTATQRLEK
jgi:hypothetical protein